LKYCARRSFGALELVHERSNVKYYNQATEHLLPFTQRITAGFWLNFLEQAGVIPDSKLYFISRTPVPTPLLSSK